MQRKKKMYKTDTHDMQSYMKLARAVKDRLLRNEITRKLDDSAHDCILDDDQLPILVHKYQIVDKNNITIPLPVHLCRVQYDSHSWEMQVNSGVPSEHGSMEELSAADVASRIPTPPTFDQMASMSQLVEYLDSLMVNTRAFSTPFQKCAGKWGGGGCIH